MIEPVLQQRSTSSRGKPYSTYQAANNNCSFFNSTIRTLLDTHLPERKIRRCSSDRPWIDDSFRYLIRRRQIALLSENQPLYRHYRNKINRARKSLQRKYYQIKIKSLENEHPKRWWNSVKELVGVNVNCDNLQGLAYITLFRKLQYSSKRNK